MRVHVVYHAKCYPDETFPSEDDSRFFLFAVNERARKEICSASTNKSLKQNAEFNLPWHDPFLQTYRYNESSAFSHILLNKLFVLKEDIGVCQYDHCWSNAALQYAVQSGKSANTTRFYGLRSFQWLKYPCGSWNPQVWAHSNIVPWSFLLANYNCFFGTSHDIDDLSIAAYHEACVAMPAYAFTKLSLWLLQLQSDSMPWCREFPWHPSWPGSVSIWCEYAVALFLGLQEKEGVGSLQPLNLAECSTIPLGETKLQHNSENGSFSWYLRLMTFGAPHTPIFPQSISLESRFMLSQWLSIFLMRLRQREYLHAILAGYLSYVCFLPFVLTNILM